MTRARRAIAALTLSLTVGSAFFAGTAQAGASALTAPTTSAAYTVVAGDYLSGIAGKLKVRMWDLLSVNKLTVVSLIYPGMKLVVPTGGVLPAATPAPAAPVAAPAPASGQYTVKAGDFLSGIASKLGVSLSALLTTNKLTVSSAIFPGTKLTVPAGGKLPTAVPVAAAPASPTAVTGSQLSYTVRSGDYLTGIAGKLGVTTTSLLTLNKLTLNSMIYPGRQLLVPAGGKLPTAATSTNSGSAPVAAPAAGTTARVTKVIDFARAQLGEPYKFNAAGPDLWDCSGLTLAAFAEIGISLPHYSGAQVNYGTAVDWKTQPIMAGDLVFLESFVGSGIVNHVGLAINGTQWIHAPRTGDVVRIGNLPTARVIAVRRIVQGG